MSTAGTCAKQIYVYVSVYSIKNVDVVPLTYDVFEQKGIDGQFPCTLIDGGATPKCPTSVDPVTKVAASVSPCTMLTGECAYPFVFTLIEGAQTWALS